MDHCAGGAAKHADPVGQSCWLNAGIANCHHRKPAGSHFQQQLGQQQAKNHGAPSSPLGLAVPKGYSGECPRRQSQPGQSGITFQLRLEPPQRSGNHSAGRRQSQQPRPSGRRPQQCNTQAERDEIGYQMADRKVDPVACDQPPHFAAGNRCAVVDQERTGGRRNDDGQGRDRQGNPGEQESFHAAAPVLRPRKTSAATSASRPVSPQPMVPAPER